MARFFFQPLPVPHWCHYSSCSWCQVAALSSTVSPLQTLNCPVEKNASDSIRCACAKGLYQDICSWSNQGEHCTVMADWERVKTQNRRNKLTWFGRGTKFVVKMGKNIRGVVAFGTCLEECHCKQGGSLKMFKAETWLIWARKVCEKLQSM